MRKPLIISVLVVCALFGRAQAQTATIEFPVQSIRAPETNAVIVLLVGRAGNLMSAATVDYATTDVLAVAGLDYVGTNGTLSFAAGETNQIISIPILKDALREGSESFQVELTNPGPGATLGTRTVAVVSIIDNDTGIQFFESTVNVSESASSVVGLVVRQDDLDAIATVDYATEDGTAIAGRDYQAVSGTLTVTSAPGRTNQVIIVPLLNDALREGSERFFVRLSNPSPGTSLGARTILTVILNDNETGVEFSQANYSVIENAGSAILDVRRGGDDTNVVEVSYYSAANTAKPGADYTEVSGTLRFEPGETNKQIVIPLLNDGLREATESFRVYLTNAVNNAVLGVIRTATITIQDNDVGFEFAESAVSVDESVPQLTATVLRQDDLQAPASVDYATADGTAVAGSDYQPVSGTLTFAAGQTSRMVTVPLLNDGLREGTERFYLRLSNPTPGTSLGARSALTVSINDNERGVEFAQSDYGFSENAGTVSLAVRRGGDGTNALEVSYSSAAITATPGSDYTEISGTLRFEPGDMVKWITLPILNDGLMETNETLRVTLTSVTGDAGLGPQRAATITIYDNDQPPSVQSLALPETAGITNLVVRRNDDGNAPISVTYAVTGGTATPGEDFILSYGTLQFPPGFSTRQIPLAIIDDALAEGDETIELTLINSANGWTNKSYVLIQDDEKPVVLDPRFRAALDNGTGIQAIAWQTNGQVIVSYFDQFGNSLLQRLNSDGSLDAGFRTTTTNRPIYALALQADGRILCAGDFSSRPGIMRLLPDGSADAAFTPGTNVPAGPVFHFYIEQSGRIVLAARGDFNGTLRDTIARLNADGSLDSGFTRATVAGPDSWVNTMAGQDDGKVLLGGSFSSVNGTTRKGLARLNADGSLDVGFNPAIAPPPGDSGRPAVFAIVVQPDAKIVAGGMFARVSGLTRWGVARLHADGTLDETFDAGLVYYPSPQALALQPDGKVLVGGDNFTANNWNRYGLVRLLPNGALDSTFTIYPNGQVGRILIGPDDTALITGSFSLINEGRFRQIARLFTDSAKLVGVQFAQTTVTVAETNGLASVRLERLGNIDGSVTATYATRDDLARAGQDYTAQSGTVTFGPFEREKTITVPLLDDGLVEGDETFSLTLSSASPGMLVGPRNLLRVQILDNEVPVVVDRTFDAEVGSGNLYATLVQPDGKILLSGYFSQFEPSGSFRVIRLNADGSRDNTFGPAVLTDGTVQAFAVTGGNKILISGWFSRVNGVDRPGFARLNSDGSLDTAFLPPPELSGAHQIVTDAAGRPMVLIECGSLFRLKADGTIDPSFASDTGGLSCPRVVALLSDGNLVVGGDSGVVRLKPNGALDTNFFNVPIDGGVQSLSVQADGKLVIGGWFQQVGGSPRGGLARLNADGTLDAGFSPTVRFEYDDGNWNPGSIQALTLQSDGRVLIAGAFDTVNGAHRPNVARLNQDGSLDQTLGPVQVSAFGRGGLWRWSPSFSAIVDLPDGNVLLFGNFYAVNGIARNNLVRLFGSAALSSFEFDDQTFAAAENGGEATITVKRLGDITGPASVRFSTGVGTATEGADYLAAFGTLTFAPLENSKTFKVQVLDDGIADPDETVSLLLSDALGVALIGLPKAELRIIDNERPGSIDLSFNGAIAPDLGGWTGEIYPHGLVIEPDGKLLLSGDLLFGPDNYRSLARLNTDGTLDSTFKPVQEGMILVAVQPDGRLIVRRYVENGTQLSRLLPDGSLDATFSMSLDWNFTDALVLPDGKIIAVGGYTIGNLSLGRVRRLNSDGSLDPAFHEPNIFGGDVRTVQPSRNGGILIGGWFESVNGQTRSHVARLNPDGSLDTSFIPAGNYSGVVLALTEQSDGQVLLGGSFGFMVGTNSISSIGRLHPDGSWDLSFVKGNGATDKSGNPAAITAVIQQDDGTLLVGGNFSMFHGVPRNRIARLKPDGSLDTTFNVGEGFRFRDAFGFEEEYNSVNALAIQSDGQILVAGRFNEFDGIPCYNVARLNDTLPPRLTSLPILSDRVFRFAVDTHPYSTYVLEISEDLKTWNPVSTNTAVAGRLVFDDLDAPTTSHLFFRMVRRQ